MKTCRKCHATKPVTDFYTHPDMADGRLHSCKTCERAAGLRRYHENPELHYKRSLAWKAKNPEKVRAGRARHRKKHLAYYRVDRQKRRHQMQASSFSVEDWEDILAAFMDRCAYCGSEHRLEQDHVIPFSRGGGYTIDNIVPACRSCNASKGNRMLSELGRD